MTADILFVNFPYLYPRKLKKFSRTSRSPCVTRGGTLYMPLYLALAAAYAEKEGYKTKLIDFVVDGNYRISSVLKRIKRENPKVIVVETSTPSIDNDTVIADEVQKMMKDSKVILVGRHSTHAPNDTLKRCNHVNILARGYYFEQVVKLMEGEDHSNILGISYKHDGKIYHNRDATNFSLDGVHASLIYRRDLNLTNYFYASMINPYILINWKFGCPYNCSFCNEFRKSFLIKRSVDDVIEELIFIKKEMKFVRSVLWDDPTFVVDEDEVCELCNKIIDKKLNLHFGCATRANVSKETLKIMKKAGFDQSFHIGLETPNQETLSTFIKKGMKFEEEVEYLENCKEVGIRNHACFIIGFPNDTEHSLRMGLNYIKRLPAIDTIQVFPLIPTPFEDIFDKESENSPLKFLLERGFISKEVLEDGNEISYWKYLKEDGSYNVVVNYPHLSKERIEWWIERYYKEFYFRPKIILQKAIQSLLNYHELERNLKGAYSFAKSI